MKFKKHRKSLPSNRRKTAGKRMRIMKKKNSQSKLTNRDKFTIVKYPVRDAIIKELRKREWTAYRLAKEVRGLLTPQSVYDYIAGRSDMTGRSLAYLMQALSLEVRAKEL